MNSAMRPRAWAHRRGHRRVPRDGVALKLADDQARPFITNQIKDRAWQLATKANAKPGDLCRAAELGAELVVLQPNARNWHVLGIIRYRGRDWNGCIESHSAQRAR